MVGRGLFGSSTRKKRPFGAFDILGVATPGIGDDVVRQQRGEFDTEVGAVSQQPGMIPTQEPVGQQMQPQGPKSFWGGGEKFRWQDGLAAALAAVGDGLSQRGGGQGGAVQMLTGGRSAFQAAQRKAQERQQEIAAARQRAMAAGFTGPMADLVANGDAKVSDIYSKPTGEMQNFEKWQGWDDGTRQKFGQFKDQTDPLITGGYGSSVVSRSALPQSGGQSGGQLPPQFDPNEWDIVPDPRKNGGVGLSGAPRRFR